MSGWARRGPSGVIGTNKADAVEVVASLLEDLGAERFATHPEPDAVDALLEAKGVRPVSEDDWDVIRRVEAWRGAREERRAIKFDDVEQMLRLVEEADESGGIPRP